MIKVVEFEQLLACKRTDCFCYAGVSHSTGFTVFENENAVTCITYSYNKILLFMPRTIRLVNAGDFTQIDWIPLSFYKNPQRQLYNLGAHVHNCEYREYRHISVSQYTLVLYAV